MSRRKHAWAAFYKARSNVRDPRTVEAAVIEDFLDDVDGEVVELDALAADTSADVALGINLAMREVRHVAAQWTAR